MRRAERVRWIWTGGEVLLLLVLGWFLWESLFGRSGFLATVSRPLRLAGLASVGVQLAVPLLVYLYLRRRVDSGLRCVHVAAISLRNVSGLAGTLAQRRRGE